MKKWGILGVVILGGLILVLQHYINRGERKMVPLPQSSPAEQIGVALPPVSTGYVLPESSYDTSAGNYNSLTMPTAQSAYQGACAGGSLAGIYAAHGKTWGYSIPKTNIALEFKDTEILYKFWGDYSGCVAASRADISACDALPGELKTELVKIPLDASLYTQCRKKIEKLLPPAFQAGKINDEAACRSSLTEWTPEDLAKISVPEFCAALPKGHKAAADYLLKLAAKSSSPVTPEMAQGIARGLPLKEADCKGETPCLEQYVLYRALESGHPQDCPKEYVPYCRAISSRSTTPCDAIVKDMSTTYCAAVERVKKRSGGFFGLTQDEMKNQIVQEKARKASEELQKKEDEKRLTEINKKAKKILGKE